MEKTKQYKYTILIFLITLGAAFYWYELRPYLVKKDCYSNQSIFRRYSNEAYERCLHKNGL